MRSSIARPEARLRPSKLAPRVSAVHNNHFMAYPSVPPPPDPVYGFKSQPLRPRMAPRSSFSFALVASQYNLMFTQPMVDHACRELTLLEQGAKTSIFWAPGAFEIPVMVKLLTRHGNHDAILAFGVLLQGETAHAQLVATSVTNALQIIAVDTGVPIIDAVLLLDSSAQAQARCVDPEKNRGMEAARAAVTASRTAREILSH
jgi:6,7-dimethyl-8-ribityllumazine synthase